MRSRAVAAVCALAVARFSAATPKAPLLVARGGTELFASKANFPGPADALASALDVVDLAVASGRAPIQPHLAVESGAHAKLVRTLRLDAKESPLSADHRSIPHVVKTDPAPLPGAGESLAASVRAGGGSTGTDPSRRMNAGTLAAILCASCALGGLLVVFQVSQVFIRASASGGGQRQQEGSAKGKSSGASAVLAAARLAASQPGTRDADLPLAAGQSAFKRLSRAESRMTQGHVANTMPPSRGSTVKGSRSNVPSSFFALDTAPSSKAAASSSSASPGATGETGRAASAGEAVEDSAANPSEAYPSPVRDFVPDAADAAAGGGPPNQPQR